MARFLTLLNRFGERQTTGAEVDLTPAYTVPAGAELGITDIKVMTEAAGALLEVLFWLNDTVSGHQWCAYFGAGAGIYSCHWETPIPFAAGAVVSLTVLGPAPADDVLVAGEWEGELLS